MDTVFILTWLYGLVIMSSISYMNFHVMESWVLRRSKEHPWFGLFVAIVELVGLTVFAYCATVMSATVEALQTTSIYFVIATIGVKLVKIHYHIRDLP